MFRLRISGVIRPYVAENAKRKLYNCRRTYNYRTVDTHTHTHTHIYIYIYIHTHNSRHTYNCTTVDKHIIIQL